jgi:hypothetical protein
MYRNSALVAFEDQVIYDYFVCHISSTLHIAQPNRRPVTDYPQQNITMCWITLSPIRRKHHHHHRDQTSDSSIEHLIRRDGVSLSGPIPTTSHPSHHNHQAKIRIVEPFEDEQHHHHHLLPHLHHHHNHHLLPHLHHKHPHMHPLHLHPTYLHGHSTKRVPLPSNPPPSRTASPARSKSREPTYRIQPISSPAPRYKTITITPDQTRTEIQETTRTALRDARPRSERRIRRVAGYEVLGRDVPWNWDSVSSAAGSSVRDGGGGGGRKGSGSSGGLKFPPFGAMDKWM